MNCANKITINSSKFILLCAFSALAIRIDALLTPTLAKKSGNMRTQKMPNVTNEFKSMTVTGIKIAKITL
jgi:hypothetical protein